jgi:hypothetical protein
MRRTLAACALPALTLSIAWLRLEDPRLTGEAFGIAVLAVAPALLPVLWQRALAVAAACFAAVWVALDAQPWELLPYRDQHVLAPAVADVERGLGDYYRVILPFASESYPEMHALVLLAIFGFSAATALLVAARHPLAAVAVVVAGVGWPATLISDGAVGIGALALAAALSIPLALRVRSGSALAAGGLACVLVVGGAATAASATTFARDAALDWTRWDFSGAAGRTLAVRFVWDANYTGVSFPPTRTVVLRIAGPERAQYWRASTLDAFLADHWYEDPPFVLVGDASGALAADGLTPARARIESRWIEQEVDVKALVDERMVAAGTPVAVDAPSLGRVFFFSGGVVRAQSRIERGTRYRVWSYVPDPSPAALASARPRYPRVARRYLEVWGQSLPAFGAPARDTRVDSLLAAPSYSTLSAYRPLYESARRVAGDARSPYAAVLALESWFRRGGGFTYDESPPQTIETPPLVHFVSTTRSGYCQHFAGAMALMLRFLGIPARVAVGFTSGTFEDGAWTVTDHDAHAWVEAWFPGHGWVPFDPTPGRGTFAGSYSFASDSQQAIESLQRGELDGSGRGRGRESPDRRDALHELQASGDERPSLFGAALLVAAVGAFVIGVAKWGRRRIRYLTRDPRATAAASRRELEAFLRDQAIVLAASATLEDLERTLGEELGLDGGPFVEAAGRARFGPPTGALAAARAAHRELHILLRRLRGELSTWARLRGFVSLRSLRGWQE